MQWIIRLDDEFEKEFDAMPSTVKDALLAVARLLGDFGPQLGRPHVDTLKGSKFANMKELRFSVDDAAWRVAFAFDPARHAMLLVAGDKSGMSQTRFHRRLIALADKRFAAHLARFPASR